MVSLYATPTAMFAEALLYKKNYYAIYILPDFALLMSNHSVFHQKTGIVLLENIGWVISGNCAMDALTIIKFCVNENKK